MAKLYFEYGTVGSRKSAQLMMVHHKYMEQGKKVLVFKPKVDNLFGPYVWSRAFDKKIPAIMVDKHEVDKMFNMVKEEKPHCVLIDEVQFMPEHQIDELVKIVDLLNVPVICYGLMTDFQTNLFEGSKRLVEAGAKLIEVKSVCEYCINKAIYNMRIENGVPVFEGEQIKLGLDYKAVCRCCYNEFKRKSLEE